MNVVRFKLKSDCVDKYFELIDKKARPGRNPKTGENVTIKARRVVTFRAGNKLRQKIASFDE